MKRRKNDVPTKRNKVFCEHCGEIETYTKQYIKDGIEWCVTCMYANGDITEEEFKKELGWEKL